MTNLKASLGSLSKLPGSLANLKLTASLVNVSEYSSDQFPDFLNQTKPASPYATPLLQCVRDTECDALDNSTHDPTATLQRISTNGLAMNGVTQAGGML